MNKEERKRRKTNKDHSRKEQTHMDATSGRSKTHFQENISISLD